MIGIFTWEVGFKLILSPVLNFSLTLIVHYLVNVFFTKCFLSLLYVDEL